jgi:3,4-dihydroxy 2-butanone 4-phosphate synthase / GTP cyclohydrolase II
MHTASSTDSGAEAEATAMSRHRASTLEIIEEAKNGRMFILVDDEERENEGDLVVPAQMATPDAINFMARYGRGLICLALAKERVDQLKLPMMSPRNGSHHETAFTVSIEAKEGVTTGISAADRARTIAAAIDVGHDADQFVTPGHVFPLVARQGGVLVRAGHTEAAVDVARLAGLNPSGVICEIMRDDGTMARMDDLVEFAGRHDLKIGTIRDLIAYRLHHDHNVQRVATLNFTSRFGGDWTAFTYHNKAVGSEILALVKGTIDRDRPVLVRMHQLNVFDDMLGETTERSGLLEGAMRIIGMEGSGVVVLLSTQAPNKMSASMRARAAGTTLDPIHLRQFRDYGIGAQILAELGIHEMVLLTNSRHVLVALAGYGLNIIGERQIPVGAS